MSTIRCPQCGLVGFDSNASCRRCGADLATAVSGIAAAEARRTTFRPAVFKLIRTDYLSSLALIFPVVMLSIYIVTGVFGFNIIRPGEEVRGEATIFLWMAVITTALCVPLVIRRVTSIQSLFTRGVEVPATITSSAFDRGRGRIEFSYSFKGRQYNRGAAVQQNAAVRALLLQAAPIAIVDPLDPKRAVLRDLYSS